MKRRLEVLGVVREGLGSVEGQASQPTPKTPGSSQGLQLPALQISGAPLRKTADGQDGTKAGMTPVTCVGFCG